MTSDKARAAPAMVSENERMRRALRHIVDSVARDREATGEAIYLADVAAVALGEADPTPYDRESWLGPVL